MTYYVKNEAESSVLFVPRGETGETGVAETAGSNAQCPQVDYAEECPTAYEVTMSGCEDSCEVEAGPAEMESLGRLMQLNVRIPRVCPGRRVALATILSELDAANNEYQRGLKTTVVPAHRGNAPRDKVVRRIKFVLPESLDVSGGGAGLSNARRFRVRLIAHYIDNDYSGCGMNS